MRETNDLFFLPVPLSLLHSKDLCIQEAHQFIGRTQAPGVAPNRTNFLSFLVLPGQQHRPAQMHLGGGLSGALICFRIFI